MTLQIGTIVRAFDFENVDSCFSTGVVRSNADGAVTCETLKVVFNNIDLGDNIPSKFEVTPETRYDIIMSAEDLAQLEAEYFFAQ